MAREWAISSYKARLDSAMEAERWEEADRVRVAIKRRLLEMMSTGSSKQEFSAARELLAESYNFLRFSKGAEIGSGATAMAAKMLVDAETAGIAVEHAPLPKNMARDVKEKILRILSSGNRRPWTTTELASEVQCSVETASRAISQLRAEKRVISRRSGRSVLHRMVESQTNSVSKVSQGVVHGIPVGKTSKQVAEGKPVRPNLDKTVQTFSMFDAGRKSDIAKCKPVFRGEPEASDWLQIKEPEGQASTSSGTEKKNELHIMHKQPLINLM